VHAYVKEGVAKNLTDGMLVVEFPLSAAKKYPLANAPASFQKAQAAVHAAAPGIALAFHLEKPTAPEADLLAIFGDNLTIE